MKQFTIGLAALLAGGLALAACEQAETIVSEAEEVGQEIVDEVASAGEDITNAVSEEDSYAAYGAQKLASVLADPRRDEDRARDAFRNPGETLTFFGIQPNMTVVEALPGGGWYTRVILPYVHQDGSYIAMNYPMPVFEQIFGDRLTDERRASLQAWDETFLEEGAAYGPEGAVVDATIRFTEVPDEMAGAADAVLYIRALHNMARLGMLDAAAEDAFKILKSGGVVGVVQHRAKADAPDDYADGSKGYLREADVIAAFEAAGFTLEESSDINANPNDPADHEQGVWAMPPTGAGGEATAELGESDRMTLRFRKP